MRICLSPLFALLPRALSARVLSLRATTVLSTLLLLVTTLGGCVDGNSNECACGICRDAVALTVEDAETGADIEDFLVEVTHNETVVGQPDACRADVRDDNTCEFGSSAGIYRIVIRAPDFETREATVRIGEEAASQICCSACIRPREITVELTHL